MPEKRYIISEAAEKTGIESHVLRYWEEELDLEIPRNEMGHRYYTENQIELFKQIKELKDKGYQLKAVKSVLGHSGGEMTELVDCEMEIKKSEDKLAQFEQIIGDIVTRSLLSNNARLQENISTEVTDRVSTKVIKEMDYLFRVKEESEEERFKKLDETIRGLQKSNKEAAVYKEKQAKKKKRFFK